jgi:hypothetical protein
VPGDTLKIRFVNRLPKVDPNKLRHVIDPSEVNLFPQSNQPAYARPAHADAGCNPQRSDLRRLRLRVDLQFGQRRQTVHRACSGSIRTCTALRSTSWLRACPGSSPSAASATMCAASLPACGAWIRDAFCAGRYVRWGAWSLPAPHFILSRLVVRVWADDSGVLLAGQKFSAAASVVQDKTGPVKPRSSGQYCKWLSATRHLE